MTNDFEQKAGKILEGISPVYTEVSDGETTTSLGWSLGGAKEIALAALTAAHNRAVVAELEKLESKGSRYDGYTEWVAILDIQDAIAKFKGDTQP